MTDPTAHWSPSEVDDDGDRASYPPPPALDLDAIDTRFHAAAKLTATGDERAGFAWRSASDVPDLVARVRELEAQLSATEADARVALDALHARIDAAEAEVGRLRGELAATSGVTTPPTDEELSDDAATWIVTAPHSAGYAVRVLNAEDARRYRDTARGVHVWHLWDERTGCPAPRHAPCTCGSGGHPRECKRHPEAFAAHVAELNAEADADRDHCPTCGALDLDHTCHADAGERFASKPPRVVFLHRPKELDPGEREAAARHFVMAASRLDVRAGDVVIARHFAWPWPRELFVDLRRVGARPVNDVRGHAYAADLLAWTADLGDLCPAATDRFETLPERGPFIVKGEKADKGRWSRMFAETREDAIRLRSELMADSGMRNTTIVARQYVALAPLGDAPVPGACPPSVEFRVFVAFGRVLSAAYYWPPEDCDAALLAVSPKPADIPADFLAAAIARVSPHVDFFTLDVGVDCDGRWWVIEVSDGLRAGMSENDPAVVYAGLADAIAAHYSDAAQLAARAGAQFAAEHPYAAGAMHGGIAHRSEVKK